MKAILLEKYGLPHVLKVGEVSKPSPKDNEVLVKIHAASINDWDWGFIRGNPFIIRLFFGLMKPKINIPGVDVSGTIEEVGEKVDSCEVGDNVYCDLSDCGFGGFAQYVCVPEKSVYKKPSNLSHTEAAALPHAGVLALQGLLEKGEVKSGQRILINGAGGGVGTLAIQILDLLDVKVTGVDSAEKLGLMKSLGYDKVMDYRKTDFTATGAKYDLILDTKTNRSVFKYVRSLKENGRYITVGGLMFRLLETALMGSLISLYSSKKLSVLALEPNKGLEKISKLAEEGHITPIIDGPYTFDEIPKLIQYFGEAKHLGKIVVDIIK